MNEIQRPAEGRSDYLWPSARDLPLIPLYMAWVTSAEGGSKVRSINFGICTIGSPVSTPTGKTISQLFVAELVVALLEP